MAEIHVPKDAKIILDEIIELAEQVVANDNYYHEYPDVVGHEEVTKFNQDFRNLQTAIRLLGCSWCEMNPITYFCSTMSQSGEAWSFRFHRNDGTNLEEPVTLPVPFEIFKIVHEFGRSLQPSDRSEMASEVLHRLTELRAKVITRNSLAQSAELEFPEAESQKDEDAISKPRLINAGRTIVCSKGTFDFTVQQAKVIKIMWEKGFNSQEFCLEQEILEEAGIGGTSFANVFKSRKKEFNAVFEQHKSMKDCWRLNLG